MFVDTSRVAVTADGEIDPNLVTPDMDVMYIRKKMDFGTIAAVRSAMIKIASGAMDFDIGAYQLALARHNILEWSGPSFVGVPCLPKNIDRLDPNEPILTAALNAIGERNANTIGGVFNSPKPSTPAGVQNGAASQS